MVVVWGCVRAGVLRVVSAGGDEGGGGAAGGGRVRGGVGSGVYGMRRPSL